MANALGERLLARYELGTATAAHLATAVERGWLTQAEHDAAVDPADRLSNSSPRSPTPSRRWQPPGTAEAATRPPLTAAISPPEPTPEPEPE